jgi:uncharacterized OB-fold protein
MRLPLKDRISNTGELKAWKGEIPFRYEYTAGIAGERFLGGLRRGKILAAECGNCRSRYVPPKVYCVKCYLPMKDYVEVGPRATVSALAESYVDFGGRRRSEPRVYAFMTFEGVNGGLVHLAGGKGLEVGSRVVPKFAPASRRKGSLLDIELFVRG